MADLAELEARLRVLEDIEAIKKLKAKYFRCLDSKLWDEMAQCFTEDATTDYHDGKYKRRGVDAIMQFLKKALGRPTAIEVHYGHHPEIEITGDTTAKGVWALYALAVETQANTSLRGAYFYHDEYVKEEGEWKIQHTGFISVFEENWDRADTPSLKLTANMFAPSGA